MKKCLSLALLLLAGSATAQRAADQYSLEAGYGLAAGAPPSVAAFSNFDAGFRYMLDESWGIKFDYGHATFDIPLPENGKSKYNRYSFQIVHNLGRTLLLPARTNGTLNMLAHGGFGYSSLKSDLKDGVDNIGNIIIGITPQVYLTEQLAFYVDGSFILNVSQHYQFDGRHKDDKTVSFTGKLFTLSAGLTFYFGKHKSDADWR